MRNELAAYMLSAEYALLPTNLPEFMIFIKTEYSFVNVIQMMEIPADGTFTKDSFVKVRDTAKEILEQKGLHDMHILSLILCEDLQVGREACLGDNLSWVIDTTHNKLCIDDSKVSDYYGLKKVFESFLADPTAHGKVTIDEAGGIHLRSQDTKENEEVNERPVKHQKYSIPYATVAVTAVNIIVFILCTVGGEVLYNIGEMSAQAVFEGEWYRLLTAMFLHVDVSHIFSNMLMLYLLGETLEKESGRVMFLVVYFTSGVFGNIVSCICKVYFETQIPSVGASGAVFGVVGAILALVVIHKGHLAYFTTSKIFLLIAFILYAGFSSPGVDNAAHVGGMVFGFLIAIPIYFIQKALKKKKLRRKENIHEN